MREPVFDIREVPFSSRGSWLNLSPVVGWHDLRDQIHLVSHRNGIHGVLRLEPLLDGKVIGADWRASASTFVWQTSSGTVEAVFDGPDLLRLRGRHAGLRLDATGELTPHSGTYLFVDPVDDAAVFTSYESGRRIRVTSLSGSMVALGSESIGPGPRTVVAGDDGRPWEIAVQETTAAEPPAAISTAFDEVRSRSRTAFADYVTALAPWADGRTPGVPMAAYVLWSATVAPEGFLRRETVLMSKHWMDKLWSWDHCFNAEALALGLPDLAVDQYLAPFDHADDAGAPPDSISHAEVLRNYVKPPVHGWALGRIRTHLGRALSRDELVRIHAALAAWCDFWMTHRTAPGSDLPYYQHGNDSGWDNASTFDSDRVVVAPDLAALLVLQLEVVADLAEELEAPSERWRRSRDTVLEELVDRLWTEDGFVAIGAVTGRPSSMTSLLRLVPIVLGERLPAAIRDKLADDLVAHLTPYGLATELPTSPAYEADGYWRGPIWAPSTALIEDGLRRAGHRDLADRVSAAFRRLCERSGFAENFDAHTGRGLRDRSYTWTASVYLNLARDFSLSSSTSS